MLSRREMLFGRLFGDPPDPPSPPARRAVMRYDAPPAPAQPVAGGLARANPWSCLNTLGGTCSVCVERCPEPGALAFARRIPVVDPARCTGCARCVAACPAPGGAIVVGPRVTP